MKSTKSTQPLPAPDASPIPAQIPAHDTHPLSLRLRRSRGALFVFAGGATCAWIVSGAMSRAVLSEKPPRALPKSLKPAPPERMTLQEWQRRHPSDAAFVGARASVPNVEASVLPSAPMAASPISASEVALEVADSNEDGTAWKGFVARSEGDRRRLADRREEDRLLQERRVLEDEKKRVERELELRALQEKFRGEDRQAGDARRDEDKRRIQGRVDEDRKSSDERDRGGEQGEQLAEAPTP